LKTTVVTIYVHLALSAWYQPVSTIFLSITEALTVIPILTWIRFFLAWRGFRWRGLRWRGLRWRRLRWRGLRWLWLRRLGLRRLGLRWFWPRRLWLKWLGFVEEFGAEPPCCLGGPLSTGIKIVPIAIINLCIKYQALHTCFSIPDAALITIYEIITVGIWYNVVGTVGLIVTQGTEFIVVILT